MIRAYSRYPQSVRDAAVRRYVTTDLSYAAVAEQIGCSKCTLRSWVHAAQRAGLPNNEESDVKQRPDDRSAEEKMQLIHQVPCLPFA